MTSSELMTSYEAPCGCISTNSSMAPSCWCWKHQWKENHDAMSLSTVATMRSMHIRRNSHRLALTVQTTPSTDQAKVRSDNTLLAVQGCEASSRRTNSLMSEPCNVASFTPLKNNSLNGTCIRLKAAWMKTHIRRGRLQQVEVVQLNAKHVAQLIGMMLLRVPMDNAVLRNLATSSGKSLAKFARPSGDSSSFSSTCSSP